MTAFTAFLTNHGRGDIDEIALSKSTTRRSSFQARKQKVDDMKEDLQCSYGQVKFDGKLLRDLAGFVQEEENQILGMV